MNKSINVTKVLFWSVILIVFSFALTGQILGFSSPSLNSKLDETIKINEQQAGSPEGKIRLATAYYEKFHESDKTGYLDDGIDVLEDVDANEFPIKNYLLGIFNLEEKKEEIALKYLEDFMKDEPMHQEALLAKGAALLGLGKNQEAIETLKSYAKIKPGIADSYELMSKAYLNLGNKKMAEKMGRQAKELLGGDPEVNLGAN